MKTKIIATVGPSCSTKEKLDLLDASIKTIVEKLTQVRGLGCPKLRASELLGFCEEILEDYYDVLQ